MRLFFHKVTAGALVAGLWLAATPPVLSKEKPEAAGLSAPVFSPAGGVYATNLLLRLAAAAPAAVIRYTLDGQEPDESAAVYSAPILLTNSTLVRAKTFAPGSPASPMAAQTYALLDTDLLDFSSNLPLIMIDSFGSNIVHDASTTAGIQLIDAGKSRARLANPPQLSTLCLVHIRGRSSLRYPKNSFTVKITDGEGDPAAVSIVGMPAQTDWVLYAPYPDKTLMRDALAYELDARMGHWASRTRFVEVFVNRTGAKLGLRDYVGVYVLEEKIKRDRNRVNIAKLKPDDNSEPRITGGYIFKKDHLINGNMAAGAGDPLGGFPAFQGTSSSGRSGFPTGPGGFPADPRGFSPSTRSSSRSVSSSSSSSRTSGSIRPVITNYIGRPQPQGWETFSPEPIYRGDDDEEVSAKAEGFRTLRTNEFFFVEPPPGEINAVQKAWLKGHLNEFETVLYGADFKDPAKGYAAYIDVDSFIDYHLIVETTKNVDGFRFSVFFHKDRGGKIKADPVWDWNLSFGNASGKQGWLPEYWLWPQLDDREYSWYRRLFEDPDFGQRYVDRWTQLRTNLFATSTILARVDEWAALLHESQARNFERWPILGRTVNPNYFVGSTYEEEVTWMKNYIETRLDWLEKQFLRVPKLSRTPGQNGTPSKAELSATDGQIYFTLDGTDPRASGGQIAPAAKNYQGPVALNRGTKLFARSRLENRWSGPLVFETP